MESYKKTHLECLTQGMYGAPTLPSCHVTSRDTKQKMSRWPFQYCNCLTCKLGWYLTVLKLSNWVATESIPRKISQIRKNGVHIEV